MGGRREVDGPDLQVGQGGDRGGGRDPDEPQGIAVGVGVVGQRVQGDGLALARHVEVGVGRRGLVAGLLHVDLERSFALRAPVGDGEGHGLGTGPRAELADLQGAVLGELDGEALGGLGVLEEDLVAVGVAPVAQDVVLDLRALPDLDGGDDSLRGRGVLAPRVDGDADGGGVGVLPVRGLVGETGGPRLRVGDIGDLEGAPSPRGDDRPEAGAGGRAGGEDVAVGVGVVVQDGQQGGAPGADAELVVLGVGRGVLLLALGVFDFVDEVGGLLLLLGLGELLLDFVPVVDDGHVLVGQPHGSEGHVVEDDGGAVGAEDDFASGFEGVDDVVGVLAGIGARAQVGAAAGPGAVGAAHVPHGGGGAPAGARVDDGGLPAFEGHSDEARGGGQVDGVRVGAGLLEHGAGRDAVVGEAVRLTVRQVQNIARGIECDRMIADRRHREGRGGVDPLDPGLIDRLDGSFWCDCDQSAVRGAEGERGAVDGHRRGPRALAAVERSPVPQVRGDWALRAGHPEGPLGGIVDAEGVPALCGDRPRGERGRRAERHGGDVDGGDRRGRPVRHSDRLAGLPDVEVRGLRPQGAVEDAGVVVEMADHLFGFVDDPDAAVVHIDVGDLHALVQKTKDRHEQHHSDDEQRRHPALHASHSASPPFITCRWSDFRPISLVSHESLLHRELPGKRFGPGYTLINAGSHCHSTNPTTAHHAGAGAPPRRTFAPITSHNGSESNQIMNCLTRWDPGPGPCSVCR